MHDVLYYHRSGHIGALGIPLMLLYGLGAGLLLGIPYAYAVHYCPLIYFSFLITAAVGALVGVAVSAAARHGKVRNLPMLMLGALLGGLVTDYVSWVGYVHVVAKGDVWPWSPNELYEWMETINAQGVWSIKSSKPTGALLAAIWVIEAGALAGMAIYLARSIIGSTPFNERTGTWVDRLVTYGPFSLNGEDRDFTAAMERGDVSALASLVRLPENVSAFYQCLIHTSPNDDAFALLSVEAVSVTTGKNGKPETINRSVFRHLFITPDLRKAIEAKASEALPLPADPSPAGPAPHDQAAPGAA